MIKIFNVTACEPEEVGFHIVHDEILLRGGGEVALRARVDADARRARHFRAKNKEKREKIF